MKLALQFGCGALRVPVSRTSAPAHQRTRAAALLAALGLRPGITT